MAQTNFAALMTEQKKVWVLDLWKQARAKMFINKFMGKGSDSVIQHITSLTPTTNGDQAVIHLIADLIEDGITDDYTLEGNEEAMKAYDQVVKIDQLRHAVRNKGRMADQRSVIRFRENAKEQLAFWLADRLDQMAFLTLSGITYDLHNNGKSRNNRATGQKLVDLAFAADVTAPTSARHLRVSGTGITAGGTTNVTADDKLGYRHIVELKAYARDNYIRGVGANNDKYHLFVTPAGMAQLKLDPDFMANVRSAGVRGSSNPLFAGSDVLVVDGVYIHEYHHVFNTRAATAGQKWGQGGNVDGQRALFCGAQALAFADVGAGEWNEDTFDYDNQQGISYGKIFGFKKPVWMDKVTGQKQDFGVIALDTAI
ncbi:N4-gp56 family major capsid protein [Gallibacterium anatis]|uniref:N4-gp56 family major capsid protein n=1 Tax=Gallibacterium anatis TaxID=750 RepID=UPI0030054B4E